MKFDYSYLGAQLLITAVSRSIIQQTSAAAGDRRWGAQAAFPAWARPPLKGQDTIRPLETGEPGMARA